MENLPEMVAIQFKGIKGLKTRYAGFDPETEDKILCLIEKKDSCLIQVSPTKARQLLVDFPEEWVLVGKAADTEPLYEALMEFKPLVAGKIKPSKNIIIVEPGGKQTEVPAGAEVHIITPPKEKRSLLGKKQ